MSTRSNSLLLSSAASGMTVTGVSSPRSGRGTNAAVATTGVSATITRGARTHKERSKNFTELEKRTVLELIAHHRDVLRQGRSNSATNKSKQLVWSAICGEVNKRCRSERPRTPAQVKMWYENYKKKCKMRGGQDQPDGSGLLDSLLWQSIHPLGEAISIKDEAEDRTRSPLSSVQAADELPVNMTNGRHSCSEPEDSPTQPMSLLEPQVQIIQQRPVPVTSPIALDASPGASTDNCESNVPLNLSHPEERLRESPIDEPSMLHIFDGRKVSVDGLVNGRFPDHNEAEQSFHESRHNRTCCSSQESSPSEEEKLYYLAKRQHAIWEHEARMKILNMELKQKEEIYSMQRQLFLIELKLKMDLIEKNYGK